jgi:hypothetical protein
MKLNLSSPTLKIVNLNLILFLFLNNSWEISDDLIFWLLYLSLRDFKTKKHQNIFNKNINIKLFSSLTLPKEHKFHCTTLIKCFKILFENLKFELFHLPKSREVIFKKQQNLLSQHAWVHAFKVIQQIRKIWLPSKLRQNLMVNAKVGRRKILISARLVIAEK